jgi:hypothetical protein
MNFDSYSIIVAAFQGDKSLSREVFNGVGFGRPNVVVGFKMKPKVWTESGWNSHAKIGVRGYAFGTTLKKSAEMVEAWTNSHGEDPITMKWSRQTNQFLMSTRGEVVGP